MKILRQLIKESLSLFIISVLVFVTGFAYLEPQIIRSATDEHTVKQTVTSEISFVAAPADVTMSPSLAGITGGTADGQTQFRILSNDTSGFSVTIQTDSLNGMEGEATTGVIPHLVESSPYIPDYTFSTAPANSAAFAYSVNASTTGEIVQAFRNDTAACNTGAVETDANCWISATTSARTIINRSTATAASGATSTIFYRVIISSNPAPAIPEDIYTATTTLTATNN